MASAPTPQNLWLTAEFVDSEKITENLVTAITDYVPMVYLEFFCRVLTLAAKPAWPRAKPTVFS